MLFVIKNEENIIKTHNFNYEDFILSIIPLEIVNFSLQYIIVSIKSVYLNLKLYELNLFENNDSNLVKN